MQNHWASLQPSRACPYARHLPWYSGSEALGVLVLGKRLKKVASFFGLRVFVLERALLWESEHLCYSPDFAASSLCDLRQIM